MQRAYDALLTIPPTSVEVEKEFLATGYICNYLRRRVKEESLDAFEFFEITSAMSEKKLEIKNH